MHPSHRRRCRLPLTRAITPARSNVYNTVGQLYMCGSAPVACVSLALACRLLATTVGEHWLDERLLAHEHVVELRSTVFTSVPRVGCGTQHGQ